MSLRAKASAEESLFEKSVECRCNETTISLDWRPDSICQGFRHLNFQLASHPRPWGARVSSLLVNEQALKLNRQSKGIERSCDVRPKLREAWVQECPITLKHYKLGHYLVSIHHVRRAIRRITIIRAPSPSTCPHCNSCHGR